MYNECNETKKCEFKTSKGICTLLTSTEEYIENDCPFFAEPVPRNEKQEKTYDRHKFCKLYCKHYISTVDWVYTREPKGKCKICPLANGYRLK